MEAAVEGDDRRAPGLRARDLHGVLDGLGAGVEEDALLVCAAAGRELAELAADVDVGLVRGDHEALVQVAVHLLVDRPHDLLGVVAEVLAADAAGEVEVADAVGAVDVRAVGRDGDDGGRGDAARDPALAGGQQRIGLYLRCGHGPESAREA